MERLSFAKPMDEHRHLVGVRFRFSLILSEIGHVFCTFKSCSSLFSCELSFSVGLADRFLQIFTGTVYLITELSLLCLGIADVFVVYP